MQDQPAPLVPDRRAPYSAAKAPEAPESREPAMSLSMHEASVDVIVQQLSGLSGVLDKVAAHVAENKYEPASFLSARLFPNMYPFAKQVQVATSWGVNIPAMIIGQTAPALPEDAGSIDALKQRIAAAIEFATSVDAATLDGAADRVLTFPAGPAKRSMKARDFLLHYAMPHFYFHCTTAYDIARHNGAPLAKRDFMGPVMGIISQG
jgi:hypothetical protein